MSNMNDKRNESAANAVASTIGRKKSSRFESRLTTGLSVAPEQIGICLDGADGELQLVPQYRIVFEPTTTSDEHFLRQSKAKKIKNERQRSEPVSLK